MERHSDEIEFLQITDDVLHAFAKGQLDETTEKRVFAILQTRQDLAQKVAAISMDSIVQKMKSKGVLKTVPSGPWSAMEPLFPPDSQVSLDDIEPSDFGLKELSEYKFLRELGRGGMGVVYLARHELTGRLEVLKVLNERLTAMREARKRFEQEVRCIAMMDHKSIVRCYTVKSLPTALVLCMEYVPGKDLQHFISQCAQVPIGLACSIAIDVCNGLQHAMQAGLVHRDIKPSNVIVHESDGVIRAKILDFGLARLMDNATTQALTDEGAMLGTLEYIAPEQSQNAAQVDIRADIYSLGCTLFHMLAGQAPFSGSPSTVLLAHASESPPSVVSIRPDVPLRLSDMILKLLAKNPADRLQTPLEVATALQEFTGHEQRSWSDESTRLVQSGTPDSVGDSHQDFQTKLDTSVGSANGAVTVASTPAVSSAGGPTAVEASHGYKGPRANFRWAMGILIVCLLSGAAYFGLTIVMKGPAGTIVFKDLPEDATVVVDGEQASIRFGSEKSTLQLQPGSYLIEIFSQETRLVATKIEVKPGGENSIEVFGGQADTKDLALRRLSAHRSGGGEPGPLKLPERLQMPEAPTQFRDYLESADTIRRSFTFVGLDAKGVQQGQSATALVLRSDSKTEDASYLETQRNDFRNFHLRVGLRIDGSSAAGHMNHFFSLRSRKSKEESVGWRFCLGGNRPQPGGLNQVAPFTIMSIKHKGPSGYRPGMISPRKEWSQVDFYIPAEIPPLSRDEWHVVEFIAHASAMDVFLDGQFAFSANDQRDRVKRGALTFTLPLQSRVEFSEFSIADLGDDSQATEYGRDMAVHLRLIKEGN